MIRGLAITPPVIGRISIGHVVERNGKRLPEKDDFFTITTQVQTSDGWMLHPLHAKLAENTPNGKLRAIPVKLLFNTPDLNLRAQYSLFDRSSGRPVCVGDGQTARRATAPGIEELPCPGPEGCEFGRSGGCKLFGRLNVQIEGQDDDLGTFIFRTTGYNSIRTLAARLSYLQAASSGHCRYLPLLLRLRARSTRLSYWTPVYYADITLRDGETLSEAASAAQSEAMRQREAGLRIDELEAAARQGFANGVFEEEDEEASAIVEEFCPANGDAAKPPDTSGSATASIRPAKLSKRLSAPPSTS